MKEHAVLPSYNHVKLELPLSESQLRFIEESRRTVRAILDGGDPRLLLIVGPCSIHDLSSAREYARRLLHLAKEVEQHFFIILRAYVEKPRSATGWKGFLYDPHLDGSHAIADGIKMSRKLFIELAEMGLPAATEFLDPLTAFYFDDTITWGCIGARTSSSQIHRNLASALPLPIGFKNAVAGNFSAAVGGVIAASHPHTTIRLCPNGTPTIARSVGNDDCCVVLRGGEAGPNYDAESIEKLLSTLRHRGLKERCIVDCAHGNSGKCADRQMEVFQNVIHQRIDGNRSILGCMLESHLKAGSQLLGENPSQLHWGVSITDPCLDWEATEQLIRQGAEALSRGVLLQT